LSLSVDLSRLTAQRPLVEDTTMTNGKTHDEKKAASAEQKNQGQGKDAKSESKGGKS
jgi:hypothetical protein